VRPEAKLLAFILLAVAIFAGAMEAGALAGPVRPAHSGPIGNPGGRIPQGGMSGMHMGGG
jgi:hypothetical protein